MPGARSYANHSTQFIAFNPLNSHMKEVKAFLYFTVEEISLTEITSLINSGVNCQVIGNIIQKD